jgi:hypothetical protein
LVRFVKAERRTRPSPALAVILNLFQDPSGRITGAGLFGATRSHVIVNTCAALAEK